MQNGFNYTTYQGIGYLNVILPALKKIYKNDEKKLKETAIANLEFYNTNPHVLPFITNLQLAMYKDEQNIEDVRSIKMALMGTIIRNRRFYSTVWNSTFIFNNICRISFKWSCFLLH